ncbi:MAG: BMP family ABC transporter substrate-binding protein [Actinomycetota bacterium]|nr:BMP family ABC transporter substrate-binding protein [Actinomycetota bacterium]
MNAKFSKFLGLFLAVALIASLAVGCDGTDDEATDEGTDEGTTEEVVDVPTSDIMAAMVTDTGGLGDKSFNDLSYAGLEQAEAELGVSIKALESNEIADYEPNVDDLVAADYDVIFTVGFLMTDVTDKKAAEYPDVFFGGIDQFSAEPAMNQAGLLFKEHEAAYLAGVVAGLATLDTEMDDRINAENIIGFVGGMDIPPVEKFEVGFTLGAKSVNPDVQVISLYAGTFDDQAKGKELALSLIDQGADVIHAAAGLTGVGSITACQERGALFIGVDADQYLTVDGSGDVMLTSVVKRVDQAVFQTVKAVVDGTFVGGTNTEFGLAEDGVGLAPYHDFEDVVSADIKAAVDAARADILSGAIVVGSSRDAL